MANLTMANKAQGVLAGSPGEASKFLCGPSNKEHCSAFQVVVSKHRTRPAHKSLGAQSKAPLKPHQVESEGTVPRNHRGKPMHCILIGKDGCNINRIRDETGVDLIVPPSGSASDKYTLRGTKEAVEKAAQMISEVISAAWQEFEGTVPRGDWGQPMHWIIIGKDGCNANRIRHETGVELVVPPSGSASDKYTLRGTKEAIEKAAQMISELISANEPVRETVADAPQVGAVEAPPVQMPQSIVKTVRAPRLQRKAQEASPPVVPASIPKCAPVQAKAVPPVQVPRGELVLVDIPLPRACPKGVSQQIKEAARENAVKVEFHGTHSIRLDGFECHCRSAEREILQLLHMTKAEVPIPTSARTGEPMIGVVIGPQGSTIGRIREQCGEAFVLLPDAGCGLAGDSVTIVGTPAQVRHAVEVVQTALKGAPRAPQATQPLAQEQQEKAGKRIPSMNFPGGRC